MGRKLTLKKKILGRIKGELKIVYLVYLNTRIYQRQCFSGIGHGQVKIFLALFGIWRRNFGFTLEKKGRDSAQLRLRKQQGKETTQTWDENYFRAKG